MPSLSTIQLLMRVPLLAGITEAEAISLYMASEKQSLKKNEILVEMGQTEYAFYLVLSGQVNVVMTGDGGKSITLAKLGAGECVGEMGALDLQPASATVITDTATDVLRLDRDAFRDVLHQNPHISVTILNTLVRRLHQAQLKIVRLATVSVQGRVARTLMDMATTLSTGELQIKGRVKHAALADMVGATREMVGKAIKDLEAKGFITKTPSGNIRIQNKRSQARD
jgi:CRP/FNR family transcriptional regulator/CRP/FNR family cyclic AMP-dependent transcriptional regulator